MTTKNAVENFLSQKNLAIAGMSRNPKKFGNYIFKTLKDKGYNLFPIHQHSDTLEGQKCYPTISAIPSKIDGLIINVKPADTEKLVEEAALAGIKSIWMQQGSHSPKAIESCKNHGISEIHGECIIMFTNGHSMPHSIHRWVWGIFGKLPKS